MKSLSDGRAKAACEAAVGEDFTGKSMHQRVSCGSLLAVATTLLSFLIMTAVDVNVAVQPRLQNADMLSSDL